MSEYERLGVGAELADALRAHGRSSRRGPRRPI